MRKLHILGIALSIISLPVLAACVPFPFGGAAPGQQPYGPGGGMGPGMMGGQGGGGMMGGQGGGGMMGGGWGNYSSNPNARPITIDQAADAVQDYLKAYSN